MKLLVGLLLIAIFTAQCTGSAKLRRRRDADDQGHDTGVVKITSDFFNFLRGLPAIGSLLSFLFDSITDLLQALQVFTNGALTRVIGGTLPCVVGENTGVKCTGVGTFNNLSGLIMEILRATPIPSPLTNIIEMILQNVLDPIANMILGGAIKNA